MTVVALWLRAAMALGVVWLALAALRYGVRCLTNGAARLRSTSRALGIIESVSLGPHAMLHLVRIQGRRFALGVTQNNVALLCEVSGPPPEESAMPGSGERALLVSRARSS